MLIHVPVKRHVHAVSKIHNKIYEHPFFAQIETKLIKNSFEIITDEIE